MKTKKQSKSGDLVFQYEENKSSFNSLEIQTENLEQKSDKKQIDQTTDEFDKNLPIVSSIILGPIQRYRIYGVFPNKLFVHLLLVILASVFMFIRNKESLEVLSPQSNSFLYYFLDKNTDFNEIKTNLVKTRSFYKLDEFQDFVNQSTNNYYMLDQSQIDNNEDSLIGFVDIMDQYSEFQIEYVPTAYFKYNDQYAVDFNNKDDFEHKFYLNNSTNLTDLGDIFGNITMLKKKLKVLDYINILYTVNVIRTESVLNGTNYHIQYQWNVSQIFDCRNPSQITCVLKMKQSITQNISFMNRLISLKDWKSIILPWILILAFISLLLNTKVYLQTAQLLKQISKKYQHTIEQQDENDEQPENVNNQENEKLMKQRSKITDKRRQTIMNNNKSYVMGLQLQDGDQMKKNLITSNQSTPLNQSEYTQFIQQSFQNQLVKIRESELQQNQQQIQAMAKVFGNHIEEYSTPKIQRFQRSATEFLKKSDQISKEDQFQRLATFNFQDPQQNDNLNIISVNEQISQSKQTTQKFNFLRKITNIAESQMQKFFFKSSNLIDKMQKQFDVDLWSNLSFKKRMQLVDQWTILIIISNSLHIIGIILDVANDQDFNIETQNSFIGLGTFFIWLSLMKYLQYSPDYYVLPNTMAHAGKSIFIVFVSSLPIIIGLSFFCMTCFGSCWRFSSFQKSVIMLWSLMNGDELQNVYQEISPLNFIVAVLFIYPWIWVGNNFFTPAFLAVNEDGYQEQKKNPKKAWLSDDLKDPLDTLEIDVDGNDDHVAQELSTQDYIDKVRKVQYIQTNFINQENKQQLKVQEMLDIKSYEEMKEQIQSKRVLQLILRLDELDWMKTDMKEQQKDQISGKLEQLIDLKIIFNKIHLPQINTNLRELIFLSSQVCKQLREKMYKWQKQFMLKHSAQHNKHKLALFSKNDLEEIKDKQTESSKRTGENIIDKICQMENNQIDIDVKLFQKFERSSLQLKSINKSMKNLIEIASNFENELVQDENDFQELLKNIQDENQIDIDLYSEDKNDQ